jgi:hypothetical protein
MTNSPNPSPQKQLIRATLVASGLALVGIIVFALLWIVLGNMGVPNAPRLLAALLLPPVVISVIVGAYRLVKGPPSA